MAEKEGCGLEKVTCKKNLFWKLFLVSFVFLTYTYLTFVVGYDGIANVAQGALKVQPESFSTISSTAFELWKILVVQLTLIPALVFTWIEYDMKMKCNK
jgi:hypothetical protein